MQIAKKIVYIILLFIFVLLIAIASFLYFFDPNRLKPGLIKKIQKETGYKITIDEKISWSIYPNLGIKIIHLTIHSPDQTKVIIDANDIDMATDLISFIKTRNISDGKIYIAKLNLNNIKAENVRAQLQLANKALTLDNISAGFYQGKLTGVLSGFDLLTMPRWLWNIKIKNFQVKPLLQDLHGEQSQIKLSGLGNISWQAESSGNDRQQLIRQLNGYGVLSIHNGLVEGIDVNYFIETAQAFFNKEEAPILPENTHKTIFEKLTASVLIKNGIADTNNMTLIAPTFRVRTKGNIDLSTSDINLQLKTKPQIKHNDLEIPISITGNLDQPEIRLNTVEIQRMLTREKINKMKEKALEKIKNYIPGKPGEYLQNILGPRS